MYREETKMKRRTLKKPKILTGFKTNWVQKSSSIPSEGFYKKTKKQPAADLNLLSCTVTFLKELEQTKTEQVTYRDFSVFTIQVVFKVFYI